MKEVLFVCLGNICRSPMAEAMMRDLVKKNHLEDQITVDSAGTSDWEQGNPPHPGTEGVLAEHGISTDGLVARKITPEDFKQADYIITMDHQNLADLKKMAPTGTEDKIHLAYEVDPNHSTKEIKDPWYTHRFQTTYLELLDVLPKWLQKIQAN